ncbi:hypothetical protein CMV_008268 [Castanea mollissima]|uniref:Uncharacterized protein n=1 Tax=Castanea mollissima TaxID=60419 RepID=A0A8J4W276_9ROSI|nr:hypothetical protein CMV_008268 [Castanea mollissima]
MTTEKVFDAVQTESLVCCGLATGVNPPSPTERTIELDLKIHLSTDLVSSSHGLSIPSNNISIYHMDDIGDQSHPEILMVQEELSNPDEETEEHVEFECEGMADSEGEDGSGCEQIPEMQNKDQNIALENLVTHEGLDSFGSVRKELDSVRPDLAMGQT